MNQNLTFTGGGRVETPKSILRESMDISWNYTWSVVNRLVQNNSVIIIAYKLYDSIKYVHIYNLTSSEATGSTGASKADYAPAFFNSSGRRYSK